jgi:hypothetical protein
MLLHISEILRKLPLSHALKQRRSKNSLELSKPSKKSCAKDSAMAQPKTKLALVPNTSKP